MIASLLSDSFFLIILRELPLDKHKPQGLAETKDERTPMECARLFNYPIKSAITSALRQSDSTAQ